MKQTELARTIGVSAQLICNIEHGFRLPSAKTLARIAKALGISVDELLEQESDKEKSA
jgi:transcriptional regulator with XRE-family HTH domain